MTSKEMKTTLEDNEVIGFCDWIKCKFKDFIIFHIPNGGKRSKKEAVKLSRMGVLEGVPDLLILMPNGKSVFIEMKRIRPKGRLSEVQKDFINKANGLGHETIVAWGAEDASIKFLKYLKAEFD